jgi:3-methyladenine DNA glycosylase AlkC
MSALKDIYSPSFYNRLAPVLQQAIPGFDTQDFLKRIYTPDFEKKELKERMRHTTQVLHHFMPKNFAEAAPLLEAIITGLRSSHFAEDGLAFIFLPDYIECYGLDDYDTAIQSLEYVTQFVSCEFAVRPFLLKYTDAMMQQMLLWSKYESYKVRRFASEGCRPRLPWAMAIPALKKDPTTVLAVLENMKNDPHEWVRRSVANNLNDIAKDHPDVVLATAKKWKGISTATDAIIKHGCRTLLKQGHPEILKLYGLDSTEIHISGFEVLTPTVPMGESVEFAFTVENSSNTIQTVRLEYGLYFKKAKGQLARKVFKISERIYQPGEVSAVVRRQSFKPITTRVYYPGGHQVSIIINGQEKEIKDFELLAREC